MHRGLVGVWVLERAEGIKVPRPHGVLIVTIEGWFSMQIADWLACAGRYGVETGRFLLDPAVSLAASDVGRVRQWDWSFDRDVLVFESADVRLRWHREDVEVVTSVGIE